MMGGGTVRAVAVTPLPWAVKSDTQVHIVLVHEVERMSSPSRVLGVDRHMLYIPCTSCPVSPLRHSSCAVLQPSSHPLLLLLLLLLLLAGCCCCTVHNIS